MIRRRELVIVTIDPYDPNPRMIATWLQNIFHQLIANPRPIRLVVRFAADDGGENGFHLHRNRPRPPLAVGLDFLPATGNPSIFWGDVRANFNLQHLWIPDHEVPLEFPCTLFVDPVVGGRFRVSKSRFRFL